MDSSRLLLCTTVMLFALLFCGGCWNSSLAAEHDEGEGELSSPSTTLYALDYRRYAVELAEAANDAERRAVMDRRWADVKRALAHVIASAGMDSSFHGSIMAWDPGPFGIMRPRHKVEGDLTEELDVSDEDEEAAILIIGDCKADITLEGGYVHIMGDLDATIVATGYADIIVAGNITDNGHINLDDMAAVFIGGDVDGAIMNRDSATVWINGNLTGKIGTGSLSTELHVIGDISANIEPTRNRGGMVSIVVHGFMADGLARSIANRKNTRFHASIGKSDVSPGHYAPQDNMRALDSWWVVHSQDNGAEQD